MLLVLKSRNSQVHRVASMVLRTPRREHPTCIVYRASTPSEHSGIGACAFFMTQLPATKQGFYIKFLAESLGFQYDQFLLDYLSGREDEIDYLKNEIKFRKADRERRLGIDNKVIKATEIENYTYCPVSFAIERTFDLPKGEETQLGLDAHEGQILVDPLRNITNLTNWDDFEYEGVKIRKKEILMSLKDKSNADFFNDITESVLLFPTKEDIEKKRFFRNGLYVGAPDYIFHNKKTNKVFIVEEKYRSGFGNKFENERTVFYENHKNQLRSYLFGIKEKYKIDYGYLAYWKYLGDAHYNTFDFKSIKKCVVLKMEKDEQERKILINVWGGIQTILKNNGGVFESKYRNPVKCAKCVSSILCGHKTGRFDKFSLPYSYAHFATQPAVFPDELFNIPNSELIYNSDSNHVLYVKLHGRIWSKVKTTFSKVLSPDEIINGGNSEWQIWQNKIYLLKFSIWDAEKKVHKKIITPKELYIDAVPTVATWMTENLICFKQLPIDPTPLEEKGKWQVRRNNFGDEILPSFPHIRVDIMVEKGIIICYKESNEIVYLESNHPVLFST